ncbi:RNase H domain-containing protein [Trichonephila clavipes]|nr:RNase H domain-containing protein [Trichonephila clavipes]
MMVWGCMSSHGVGRLHIVSRTVKAMDYIEILQNKLLPTARDLFGNQSWIFLDDNAPLSSCIEKISSSSISNYDCILSPFFIPHPSERNAINTVQFSDKSTEDFPVICYTDGSKIDGRVGFAFVVFRSGVESENFQFRIRDECTVFVAELLCLNFAVKWITEQNSVISEYLICTDSFPPWILLNVFLHLTI